MGTDPHLKKLTAPCREACPAGIDVPRYIRHIREGRFAAALAVIRQRIPFPSVCGYACVHPCEQKCARNQFDEAIAIRMLKKVASEKGKPARLSLRPATGKKVAVIGSGPCGMTAAHYLNLLGHRVTVLEALKQPGGMLRYGIPGYRLPEEIVDREIDLIRESGVQLIAGRRVSSAEALKKSGYDAVLVSTGAWKPLRMGIPGENSRQVIDGISFLQKVNEGKSPAIGRKAIVVGGGNTALDASRAARRLGAEVLQLYRRTAAEMPAGFEETEEAIEEGVQLSFLTAPIRIAKGKVVCIRMRLGDADASGRRAPVPLPGSEYELPFDTLIMGIGQSADAEVIRLDGKKDGAVRVDPSLSTNKKGIFAAGDAVKGPSTIIEAIAQGRQAAEAIDRFLGGEGILPEEMQAETVTTPPETARRGTMRPAIAKSPIKKRLTGFDPVERTYGAAAAVGEATRCLSCDLVDYEVAVNDSLCKDCGYCREVCTLGVFAQSDRFNTSGYKPTEAVHAEKCIGCLRCLYICPDFSITVREKTCRG
ncbi:MAG: FAD-dependent oxidoreductase [Deltaproteobacteria bacterium]|nr:FAD-dependent oxidoreductase [Deltaproteobacteria bacterium]